MPQLTPAQYHCQLKGHYQNAVADAPPENRKKVRVEYRKAKLMFNRKTKGGRSSFASTIPTAVSVDALYNGIAPPTPYSCDVVAPVVENPPPKPKPPVPAEIPP